MIVFINFKLIYRKIYLFRLNNISAFSIDLQIRSTKSIYLYLAMSILVIIHSIVILIKTIQTTSILFNQFYIIVSKHKSESILSESFILESILSKVKPNIYVHPSQQKINIYKIFSRGHSRLYFWEPLLNCIKSRLSGWSSKHLSFGGRLILLKYALSSLPVYALSFFKAPTGIVSSIESLFNFFFLGSVDHMKISQVHWNSVCRSKEVGGMGVRRIREFNIALLGKW